LLALTACVTRGAVAQGNYNYSPLGGRSALMGGTGVALGADGAAPFFNPATIPRIESGSLAFSARFFRYSERTLDGWHQPGPVDIGRFGTLELEPTTVKDHDFENLSDSSCFFFDAPTSRKRSKAVRRPHVFAICSGKTEESDFALTAENLADDSAGRRVNQTQTLRQSWSNRSFGPSWAMAVTDEFWVGASLFVARAKHRDSLSVVTLAEDAATGSTLSSSFFSAATGDSWDLLAHLGASLRFADVFTLGVALRTPSVHLLDSFGVAHSSTFDDGTAAGRFWTGDGDFVVRTPPRLSLGLGAEWKSIRVELDGFFHLGADEYARAEVEREVVTTDAGATTSRTVEPLVIVESVRPTANVGVGVELFVARDLGLLLGLSTDLSSLPELEGGQPENALFRTRTDFFHAGAGLAAYTDYGDLVFGLRGDYGSGQMVAVNSFVEPNRLEVVDHHEVGLMLVLAGRVSLSAIGAAADDMGEVVEGDAAKPDKRPPAPMQEPEKK
jgi:hypothetical protein